MGRPLAARAVSRHRRVQIGLEKRVRSRLHLLKSAISVLGQPEGQATSIDDVIKHAGLSRGTFYNYFESRDHLLAVVAVELSQDFNDAIVMAMEHVTDPAARGDIGVRHYLQKARADSEWGWAMFNVAMNGPLLGSDTLFHITDTVRRGLASKRFRVVGEQAAVVMYSGLILSGMYTILANATDRNYINELSLMAMRAVGVPDEDAVPISTSKLPRLQETDRSYERSYLSLSLAPQMYQK